MTVAATSTLAYREIKRTGTLTAQQAQVMRSIGHGVDYSLQEIVGLTGLPINVVSGRVNELKSSGYLQHGPTRRCRITGRTIHPVKRPETEVA